MKKERKNSSFTSNDNFEKKDESIDSSDKSENVGDTLDKEQFDISLLTEEQAKEMLSALVNKNKELSALLEKLTDEKNKSETESAKFKDNWYRSVAEYENYKKRMADVRKNSYDDGIKDAVSNILGIGDSVDRALTMPMDDKTKAGVELISRQFLESLSAISVAPIDPIGKAFDPNTSEAIATLPAKCDEDDGKVVQVYKKGYELRGKILRYAQVVVGKKE